MLLVLPETASGGVAGRVSLGASAAGVTVAGVSGAGAGVTGAGVTGAGVSGGGASGAAGGWLRTFTDKVVDEAETAPSESIALT